jgi:predicted transcriptional regulator
VKFPRSSFRIVRLIVLGYLHQGGSAQRPVSLSAVAAATGLNLTMVSANNGALADLGVLQREKGGSYSLTKEGSEVARALEFEEPELLKRSLGPLLLRSDAIASALNAVRIRNGMTEDAFVSQLALASGEPKSASLIAGARAILEMLIATGLVAQEGDRVSAPKQRTVDDGDKQASSVTTEPMNEASEEKRDLNVAMRVRVTVELTAADLVDDSTYAKLRQRLRELGVGEPTRHQKPEADAEA